MHRQVGTVVTSGGLGSIMVSTLAHKARDVGSIPTLDTISILDTGTRIKHVTR